MEQLRRDSSAGGPRKAKAKFARIKGWLDRAGALALLEQVVCVCVCVCVFI